MNLDQITGKLILKTGTEEPSEFFTEKVMLSVHVSPVIAKRRNKYYLFLILIPVLTSIGWFFSVSPDQILKLQEFIQPLSILYYTLLAVFMDFFNYLSKVSLSPMSLTVFITAFSLLIIDILFRGKTRPF